MEQSTRAEVIKDIERQINNLPAFSVVVSKVLRVVDNPISSARDIEKVVKYDQVLASKILKMANSAYYGYAGKISTLSQGVVILGLNTLRALLLTASASKIMNKKLLGYRLEEGRFWEHSVLTALGSRDLANKLRYKNPEEAFVGGLLHDIGKLVLDRHVLKNRGIIEDIINKEGVPLTEAEREVLGINHANVGRRMAEKWNFPPVLSEVINFHHEPERARENKELVAVVSIINAVSLGLTTLSEEETFSSANIKPETLSILNLSNVGLEEIKILMERSFKDANSFLSLE
ncbi:MAG: hypothetical protein COS84_03825 [Armatimonadetes bacterium CG07_land_8_20_14_0_80_40_9]|nr:MAG: hypothetical protein COS84_03825 [Armatimonadetes bacterium CG07_land_8_20_14_0_80_40_9]